MALAPCRECGKEVSTEATACPHCGAPRPPVPSPSTPLGGTAPGSPFHKPLPTPSTQQGPLQKPQPRPVRATSPATPTSQVSTKGLLQVVLWGSVASLIIGIYWLQPFFIGLGLVGMIWGAIAYPRPTRGPMYCPHCGTTGIPVKAIRGSFATELVLWLLLIIPGLIYTTWRLTTKGDACPACGQAGMIPADSPKARKATDG